MPTGKGPLRIAIEDFLDADWWKSHWENLMKHLLEALEVDALDIYGGVLNEIFAISDIPPDVQKLLKDALSGRKQAGAAALLGFGTSIGTGAASSFLAPLFKMMNYGMDKKVRSSRLDVSSWVQLYFLDPKRANDFASDMSELGWSDARLDVIKRLLIPKLPETALFNLGRREKMPWPTVEKLIKQKGWSDEQYAQLYELSKARPQAQDIVRFMIKDVYNDAIVNRMGFAEDMPQKFLDEMVKIGFDIDDAKYFYYAAWEVMSPMQAYEAHHRLRPGVSNNPFTDTDLDFILKTADYPPPVRDWLKQISYNTLTRVDIRRMYQLKLMTEAQVLSAYLDDGYAPKDAEMLTKFAIKDADNDTKDLSRENIEAAYNLGIINREVANRSLMAVGYDEDEAEILLSIIEVRQHNAKMQDEIDIIAFKYVEEEIDWPTASTLLDRIGVPPDMKIELRETWGIKIRKKVKRLSKSEIENLYRNGLLDITLVRGEIEKLGYSPDNALRVIQLIDIEVAKDISKELADKQAVDDRLQATTRATAYQKRKAEFAVSIAELQLEAAEIKLAVNQSDDEILTADLLERLEVIPVEIADLRVQTAVLRRDTL